MDRKDKPALDIYCLSGKLYIDRNIMKPEFRQLRLSQLDRNLELARSLPPRPSGGWIASVREALGLSQRQVGKKMRTSGQAVQQFERSEAEDRITLRALRRVAGTMRCELVYVLVPKSGSFAELAEEPTRERVARDVKSVVHTMALEDQKPENANQLTEDEAQRRLNRSKTR
ncbi:MAG: helix-turn-helix domain-containing protein [Candidatus Acidiferrales bacterium]